MVVAAISILDCPVVDIFIKNTEKNVRELICEEIQHVSGGHASFGGLLGAIAGFMVGGGIGAAIGGSAGSSFERAISSSMADSEQSAQLWEMSMMIN